MVTSVSVIMDHGNGTRTYIADAAGHPLTQHEGPVGSPADLLAPDRYEFYTFDESGDLIKKLMTLDQIHGLIAGGDVDALDTIDSSAPTYYHAGNQGHIDVSDLEPTDIQGVHKVVANVQNVLKGELEASKNKPLSTKPISMLSVPDAASSWSILLPGVLGGAEDVMSEAVLSEPESISKFTVQSSVRPTVAETAPTQETSVSSSEPTLKPYTSDILPSASPPTRITPIRTTYEKPHTITTTTEKLSSVKTVSPTTEESTTAASTKKKVNLSTTTPAVPVTQRRTNSPTIIHYLTIQNVHATSIIPDRTTEKSSPVPLRTTPGSPTLPTSYVYENISSEQNTKKYETITPAASHFHDKLTSTVSTTSYSTVAPTTPQTSKKTTVVSSPPSSQIYKKPVSSTEPLSTTHSAFVANETITDSVSPIHTEYDLVTPTTKIYEKISSVISSESPDNISVTPSASPVYERIPSVTTFGSPVSITYNSVTPSGSQIVERISSISSSASPISTSYNKIVTPAESQIFERIPIVSASESSISTTNNPVTPSESQIHERIPVFSSSGSTVSTTDKLIIPTISGESVTGASSAESSVSTKYSSVTPPASLIYELITNINSAEPLTTTYISQPLPLTDNITEKSTLEPLRTTYSSISSPVSEDDDIATQKYSEIPLYSTYSSPATVSDTNESVTEDGSPELVRITLTDPASSAGVTNTYQPTTSIYSESSSPVSADFSQISTSKLDSPHIIPIIEGMAASLSDVLSQVTDKQNFTIDYTSAASPQSDETDADTTDDADVTTAKYMSASTDEIETQFTNEHPYTLVRNPSEASTVVPFTTANDSMAESESAGFYNKFSEPTESQKVTSEVTGAESDLPSTNILNSFTETSVVDNANEELHEAVLHLKTQQSEQVVKIVTPGTHLSQSSLPEPNKTDVMITTYKPSTYRPIISSTRKPTTGASTTVTPDATLSTSSEQLLSTLTTPRIPEYSTSSAISSASESPSDTTSSVYKPAFTTLEDNEETVTENTTGDQLSSSESYENNPVAVHSNDSYDVNDTDKENDTLKLSVQPELLDTENSLLKAGISAVTSILLDQHSPSEPQLPLPTDSLSHSSTSPELVDPVSGELKHASTFVSEYDTTAVTEGDAQEYSAVTAAEEFVTTSAPVEDENGDIQDSVESGNQSFPIKQAAVALTENIGEQSGIAESATEYGSDTMTTVLYHIKPLLDATLTTKSNTSHGNASQTIPTKESKLSEQDQSEQNVTKNDYTPADASVIEAVTELADNKEQLEFSQSVVSNNTEQNLDFVHSKPVTTPPKEETSLTSENANPTEIMEKIELKTAAPAGDSKVSFVKKPATAYRPVPSEVPLTPPTAVELHPAPHESMGLEATTAFLADDVRRFSDLCNELAFRMWTSITGKGSISSRSIVLSPFAVTSLLAMVFLGARGPTSGQMNDILRLDDMVTFNPHQVLQNITETVLNSKNFGVATASFVRELYSDKVITACIMNVIR